jgi:hypothetical protein
MQNSASLQRLHVRNRVHEEVLFVLKLLRGKEGRSGNVAVRQCSIELTARERCSASALGLEKYVGNAAHRDQRAWPAGHIFVTVLNS